MKLRVCAAFATMSFMTVITASAQSAPVYKVGWYNIQSGKGETPLPGHPAPFTENQNCTDPLHPLNAWGVGAIQAELRAKLADPDVIALGLAEAWLCGSPENVRLALGWPTRTAEHNGFALVSRYGFAAPEQWLQLDTSMNDNPKDTKWVVRAVVCANKACSTSVIVYAGGWYGTGVYAQSTKDKLARRWTSCRATDPRRTSSSGI
jgi:hypothetical protein